VREAVQFVLQHGYALLFGAVLAEQIGLPIPALPTLLAMGALCGLGHFSLEAALGLSVAASLAGDGLWYWLGVRRGHAVLNLLCRIALEPASCVRRTEEVFARNGAGALLFAKFVPGLSTAAPPMAGMFGMQLGRFAAADGAGAVLWAGAYLLAGFVFRNQLERAADFALQMGSWLLALLVGGLAAYIAWKYVQRRRFFRQLATARIAPEEVLRRLQSGEPLSIIDLRHSLDIGSQGFKLPGAMHLLPEELESRLAEIPRDRDVVLYCT
jgi:membrane protein DedA with SNARE-associated domain